MMKIQKRNGLYQEYDKNKIKIPYKKIEVHHGKDI